MALASDDVVQWAYSQLGREYRTGAQFVQAAWRVVGIRLPSTAVAQAYRAGAVVPSREALCPGDIIFPTARVSQLYVGGGYVIAVTKAGVGKYPARRVWRAVRVSTPGGGAGLALAQPGLSPAPMVTRPKF